MTDALTDQTEPISSRRASGKAGIERGADDVALHPVSIGPYQTVNNVFLAPMAGVTDRPFRILCKSFGAGYAVSEMVASNSLLYGSVKTRRRADHANEPGPIAIQLLGTDPAMLADAAKYNVDLGAQIIDFNMGCPAKKVCNVAAGSALMKDEVRVGKILTALVEATSAPVTLKIRTGWDSDSKNAVAIGKIAEDCGVRLVTVHGRTRAAGYEGEAEYDTITRVKSALSIPVIANGDIDSPEKALGVLKATGVDGVMVGRAAMGAPWLFAEIVHFLSTGQLLAPPSLDERFAALLSHLDELYGLYGDHTGSLVARKHVCWYIRHLPSSAAFRQEINQIGDRAGQLAAIARYREELMGKSDRNKAA